MKHKSLFANMLALAGLFAVLVASRPAAAQAPSGEPIQVAVVSIGGFDAANQAIEATLGAAEQSDALAAWQGLSQQLPGLDAVDKSKPWGIVVQLDGMTPGGYAFLPIADVDRLLQLPEVAAMVSQSGTAPSPDADGIYTLDKDEPNVFVLAKNGWAFASLDRNTLLNVPDDPTPLLQGLDSQYLVAVKGMIGAIPGPIKQNVKTLAGMGVQMNPNMGPAEKAAAMQAIDNLQLVVDGLDTLLLGIASASDGALTVDVSLTAVPGTEFATQLAAAGPATGRFNALASPTALVSVVQNQKLAPLNITQFTTQLGAMRQDVLGSLNSADLSDTDRQIATDMVTDLFDALQATVDGGKFEGSVVVDCPSDAVEIALGATVVDASKLEAALKQVLGLAGDQVPPLKAGTTFDAGTYDGARLHTVALPTEMLGPQAPPTLAGKQIALVAAFEDDLVYLRAGVGVDGVQSVVDAAKSDLDAIASPTAAAPTQKVSICLANLPNAIGLSGMPADMVLQGLELDAGDTITLTTTAVPNGTLSQLVVSPGMIQAIGFGIQKAIEQQASAMGPSFEDAHFELEESVDESGSDPFGM